MTFFILQQGRQCVKEKLKLKIRKIIVDGERIIQREDNHTWLQFVSFFVVIV